MRVNIKIKNKLEGIIFFKIEVLNRKEKKNNERKTESKKRGLN
jgi:hypothetical protein